MATPGEQALLGQILAEVRAVAAEVSAVQVTVARAVAQIEHRARQSDDHEQRLRKVEQTVGGYVTHTDLDDLEQRHQREVSDALELADRKATRRITISGLVLTAVIAAANYFIR